MATLLNMGKKPQPNPLGDFFNGVGGFIHDAANTVAQDVGKVGNTAAFLGTAPLAAATGNKDLQQAAANQLRNSVIPWDVATGKATPLQFGQGIAQTGLHYAPYFVGGSGKLVDELGNVAAGKFANPALKAVANKAATYGANAAISAPTFAGLNAAQQGIETGKFNPLQAIQAGGQAALMAAAGIGAHDLAKGTINGIKNTNFRDQTGSIKVPGGQQKLPLNDIPKDKATPQEVLKSLGMSDKNIKKTVNDANGAPKAPLELNNGQSRPVSPKSSLVSTKQGTPKLLASIPQLENKVIPSKGNYSKNPTEVNIPKVNAGDYEKARSNAQLASNPVEVMTGQTLHAVNKLKPAEKATFWHAVEDPSLIKSPKMQDAVNRWRDLANRVHATSQSLGGDTKYTKNYARHNWDLSDPEQKKLWDAIMQDKYAGTSVNPKNFQGLDTKQRAFKSIKEGEAAGFKLKNADPSQDILDYGNKSAFKLKQQAVQKGITEADQGKTLNRSVDLRNGQNLAVSEEGKQALRTMENETNARLPLKTYRTFNHKAKQLLLSVSQFHTLNINNQAAPALVLKGHPVRAMTGLIDSAVTLFSKDHSDALLQGALKDGTIENAARLGTPIKYGTDYTASGKLPIGKAGFGERAIFERQLPAMHIQMVKALVDDLNRKGVSLDSVEARKAGTAVNQIMGFVNLEMRNLDPKLQRGLSDVVLAPQFTRSKWATLKDAFTKDGQAGSYARAAVAGKYAADAAIIFAVGAVMGQQSDDIKDTLLRALIHPSIPTNMQDAKGNNIELGLPQNYASEALGLIGNLQRNQDGRLQPNINSGDIPGNVENYGRSRLAMVPGDALKVATNTNFANKPLYDPNASLGTQIAQGATTLGTGHLPIGLQGVTQLDQFKNAMPNDIRSVLDAQDTGKNPIIKSIGSSFGLTPRTDKTVGKGLQSTQYFNALDQAKADLNANDLAAYNALHPAAKSPVTGQYQVQPTIYDSQKKAVIYLGNPNVLAADTKLNLTLATQGQNVDPLFKASPADQKAYLNYEALAPGDFRRGAMTSKYPAIKQIQNARSAFFNTLPPSDPNKPVASIQYPSFSGSEQSTLDNYYSKSTKDRQVLYNSDPTTKSVVDKINKYNTDVLNARDIPTSTALSGVKNPSGAKVKRVSTRTRRTSSGRKSSGRKVSFSSKTSKVKLPSLKTRKISTKVPRGIKLATAKIPKTYKSKIG